MNIIQRFILIIFSIISLIGTFYVLFFSTNKLEMFVLYNSGVIIATFLSVYAFSSQGRTTKEPPVTEKIQNTIKSQSSDTLNTKDSPLNPIYFSARSSWPFDFFPDRLIIQEKAIGIVRKSMWKTGSTESIPISDIGSVLLNASLTFSALTIQRRFPPLEYQFNYLSKSDALRAKEIIDGLLLKQAKLVTVDEDLPESEKRSIIKEAGKNKQITKEII